MVSICSPINIRKTIVTRHQVQQEQLTPEGDGENSSNSFILLDGTNDKKSQRSAHEDLSGEGIFTNFAELRNIIVTEKTTTHLLELLNTSAILTDQYLETL